MPLFAFGFLAMIAVNSVFTLPVFVLAKIKLLTTLLLTIAMLALGLTTDLRKFKQVGGKAFLLAAILAVWIAVGNLVVLKLVW